MTSSNAAVKRAKSEQEKSLDHVAQTELMAHIRSQMKSAGINYSELADRMTALGREISVQGLRNALSKGTHKTSWYWDLMKMIHKPPVKALPLAELNAISTQEVAEHVRNAMRLRHLKHAEVAERLTDMGRPISIQGLTNKLSKGTHRTTWYWDVMKVINAADSNCVALPQWDMGRGSLHRLWIALGALAASGGEASLSELVNRTRLPRSTVENALMKVINGQVPSLVIERDKTTFTVKSWGTLINKTELEQNFLEYTKTMDKK